MRSLFAGGVQSLSMTGQEYVEEASSEREYFELFKSSFGPMVAIYAALDPSRHAELDDAFLQYIRRWNRATTENGVRIPYEYLLVVARKKDV